MLHKLLQLKFLKKKRLKASSFLNLEQLNTNDNKLSTLAISNDKSDSAKTWFQNKIANKTNLDFKEENYNNIDEKDL